MFFRARLKRKLHAAVAPVAEALDKLRSGYRSPYSHTTGRSSVIGQRLRRLQPQTPAQIIAIGFLTTIVVGTLLLMTPAARVGDGAASFLDALFTATSATCVTGLITVDTPTYWTPFGHAVIIALIQIGGFGVMSFGALIGLVITRKLGLRSRLITAQETKAQGLGETKRVIVNVLLISAVTEAAIAVVLALRFALGYGYAPDQAIWFGVFHSISAFNNAGFALYTDSIIGFVGDPWIVIPLSIGVILGGLGFPVIMELRRRYRKPKSFSIHTKLVLIGTVVLLVGGTVFISVLEWNNAKTLGPLSDGEKILAGFFQSTVTRTAGFNSIDVGQMHPVSWLGMDILMFIGAGPAGTAGGLKITTFAILFFIMLTEIRGGTAVNIFGKRISRSLHREALTIVLLSLGLVVGSTMAIMLMSDLGQDRILFEVVSAFATVGMSTGITAALPPAAQYILIVLMFAGRVGPVTIASALALKTRHPLYEYPKERPLIG
ncbi:potassium uptake TrkH family protein [Neomicrococcus aestuarii]|uniref:Potassium uptake TrkH family protein n=1 Tax=Neomicrococcus aestuarii TaxID=556325 RepID=A0A7W8TUG1_9MICC|nr:potassium transporter TrkG [Neomicrococcus aestuarii]MBB5513107.1 potassium uptake TrkH family protein [Neomicrococcus aestuarii]